MELRDYFLFTLFYNYPQNLTLSLLQHYIYTHQILVYYAPFYLSLQDYSDHYTFYFYKTIASDIDLHSTGYPSVKIMVHPV